MKQELLKGLTEEQKAKVKSCKNSDELLKLAKEEGIELTSEQLEAVSGGACTTTKPVVLCPVCKSDNVRPPQVRDDGFVMTPYVCKHCGHKWE